MCKQVCRKEDGITGSDTGIEYPRDSVQMLMQASKVAGTRNVTWEAPPNAGVTPTRPEISDPGGMLELVEKSGPGGTGDFISTLTTLLLFGEGNSPSTPRGIMWSRKMTARW